MRIGHRRGFSPRLWLALGAVVVLSACSSGTVQRAPSPSSSASASAASVARTRSLLVGEWRRTTTCAERVAAIRAAGLGRWVPESIAGEGWTRAAEPAQVDPRHPCAGAVPVQHTHFFTADGTFGSRDDTAKQVDDGKWAVPDAQTLTIGNGTFHITVDSTTLRLRPELPTCKRSGCFDAIWAVNVSYNGLAWTRVPPVAPAKGPVDYTSHAFVVPFTLRLPARLGAVPVAERPAFVGWESRSPGQALRVMAPVSVHKPGTVGESPVPSDYPRHLQTLTAHGATITHLARAGIGGAEATIVTLTTTTDLQGSIGCSLHGLDPGECYGVGPSNQVRLASMRVDGRTLLIWLRNDTSVGPLPDVESTFASVLAGFHFTG